MLPNKDIRDLVLAMAAAMTPATLEAVIADLDDDMQPEDHLADLVSYAAANFKVQLECLTGVRS
jgi:hypothetical protein